MVASFAEGSATHQPSLEGLSKYLTLIYGVLFVFALIKHPFGTHSAMQLNWLVFYNCIIIHRKQAAFLGQKQQAAFIVDHVNLLLEVFVSPLCQPYLCENRWLDDIRASVTPVQP